MNAAADPHAGVAAACTAPPPRVDFSRPLVCILGLPFDAVTLEQAVQRIRDDALAGRRCFVSTPNLNFAIMAQSDRVFRGSVLRSDLNLIDGMPLVWIARLLGLPVAQRVSGADVFAALRAHPGPALNVFFFGGPKGAAALAQERINQRGGGIRCVGFDEAGFGSIESMSEPALIERINASGAHFVVVALGAKKGQAWIEHNAARLTAPVLSHLGAVVNFEAGGVSRAPRWLQRVGGEWLWRIKEEPGLWRRYAADGGRAALLLCRRVLPDALAVAPSGAAAGRLETESDAHGVRLRLHGTWQRAGAEPLRAALALAAAQRQRVAIDLAGVDGVDDGVVAILLVAQAWFEARGGFEVSGASPAVSAAFRRKLAAHVLAREADPLAAEAILR